MIENGSSSDQQTSNPDLERLSYPALHAYASYYESIKDTIGQNVRQLMELGLHDVLVEDVKHGEDTLHLSLKSFWDRKRQSRGQN